MKFYAALEDWTPGNSRRRSGLAHGSGPTCTHTHLCYTFAKDAAAASVPKRCSPAGATVCFLSSQLLFSRGESSDWMPGSSHTQNIAMEQVLTACLLTTLSHPPPKSG